MLLVCLPLMAGAAGSLPAEAPWDGRAPDGAPDGPPHGTPDGPPDGAPDGPPHEAPDHPTDFAIRAADAHPCAAATERCDGELRVPLDWDDPASEEITVAFAWIPRGDTTRPARGTILANFGGPTAAIPMVPLLRQVLGPLLDRQNLLVVDPRGLGASGALECPGLDMTDPATVSACAEELGPRIRQYASHQVVRDMDAVRDALGVEQVSFYGNSYGTVFAQSYAIHFPEHTSAVYLDSVVPFDDDGWVSDAFRPATDPIELVCGRSPSCAALPGSPSGTLERLVEHLRAAPDPAVPIGGLRALIQGVNVVGTREVVAAAHVYLAGDVLPLQRLARGLRGGEWMTPPEHAGTLAIQCADASFPYDREAPPEERRRQLERFLEMERPYAPLRRSELLEGGFVSWSEECLGWPMPGGTPPAPPAAPRPGVPVLTAVSDFDTWTPDEVAEAIRAFPSTTLLRVRFGGHALAAGPWPFSECVREVMRGFLADPGRSIRVPAPDDPGGCDGESYRAVGSFPRSVEDTPPARGEELGSGERQLLAAAFATVGDAVARRNPLDVVPRPPEEGGLRGGTTRWDPQTRTITLEEVRFVEDLTLSGTVRLDADGRAAAEVAAVGPDGASRELSLRWRAFVPENETAITGLLDGERFTARVPLH